MAISPDDAVVPVGLFGYASNDLGLHMIVTVPHRNADNGLYLAFYEPQPAAPENEAVFSLVCLTPRTLDSDEIKSCLSCLFV